MGWCINVHAKGGIMAYSSRAIANYFLDLAEKEGQPLTPMKLQKLVYFAHGWHLAIVEEPLLDEQVEVWKWGPVVKSLYHAFKEFGNQPISEPARRYSVKREPKLRLVVTIPSIDEEAPNAEDAEWTKELLKRVWDVYKGFTAVQLSKMTHASGSPWDQVYQQYTGNPPKGTDIPAELIRKYFIES